MSRHTVTRFVVTAVAVGGFSATGVLTASAAVNATTAAPAATPAATPNPADLVAIKARCNTAVQTRLGALRADQQFIGQASALSGADRAALTGQVSSDMSGLTALDATIQADTTIKQARVDCQSIVAGYRVYVLEEPKIHVVIAADTVTSADTAVANLEPALQQLIDNSASSAANKAAAQSALNDLESKIAASGTAVSNVVASVINQQPSGYPANAAVLKSAAQNLAVSRSDLHSARADVGVVLHQLGLK